MNQTQTNPAEFAELPRKSGAIPRLLPWLIYPLTMALCLGLFFALLAAQMPLIMATYLVVALGAGTVTLFEWLTPARREWLPDSQVVRNDAAFMVVVQMLLPEFLSFLAAITLVRWLAVTGVIPSNLWVHSWPEPAQAALMLLAADFLRYWVHVACHRFPLLWRLHSVHHSPSQLYWLNVGRFHPIEKALQFTLDALPFILLGVGERVVAIYFVFYAVNGFFQHCNIKLRFGWLNYLVSSAELHRWHHSRVVSESNANYGNNVIIWDWLFGTRFLPKNREVRELGVINPEYPRDFHSQIKAPFVPGLDHRRGPLGGWLDLALNFSLELQMLWTQWRVYRPIKRAARQPAAQQQQVLARIILDHAQTDFGRDHKLRAGMSIEDFRACVPVQDYEKLRPYIERQDQTGALALNPVPPVMYAVTSGTLGAPKYIPVLPATLEGLKRAQRLFSCVQQRHAPDGFRGKILGIVSPAIEGHLPSGAPFGSASGFLYKTMPRIARAKYVLPAEVFEISDYDAKYYTILRLALAERDITWMGTANPSTFLRLLDLAEKEKDHLIADIENGALHVIDRIPDEARVAILRRCKPSPARAAELRSIFAAEKSPGFGSFWPYLSTISTWTSGSCGIAINSLRSRLPAEARIIDLGYLASELRVTVTVHPNSNAGLPTFWENFFEFVERDAWEQGVPTFLTLDQLKLGAQYYLFATTPSGLFRYSMNDIIEVTGHFHQTPTLRFLQKGTGCTNITGEKLYESQALSAVKALEKMHGFCARFFQVVADESLARYTLYLEAAPAAQADSQMLARCLDEELGRLNVEFKTKRASGRLQPTIVAQLRAGALEAYKQSQLVKGRREGQFKTVSLKYRRECDFDFDAHALS